MTNTFRKYWSLMNNSLSVNYLSRHSSQKKKSEHTAVTKEGSIVRKVEVVGGGVTKEMRFTAHEK